MAAITTTNIVTLKRSHAVNSSSSSTTISTTFFSANTSFEQSPTRPRFPGRRRRSVIHTKTYTWPNDRRMPLQISSQSFTDSFSTLSPIYDQDISDSPTADSRSPAMSNGGHHIGVSAPPPLHSHTSTIVSQQRPYFFHRDSVSTSASGSSCSSPTTTLSAADTQSQQETPGTSPDTPASSNSLNYPSLSLALRGAPDGKPDFSRVNNLAPPSKKPRNLKNLAVNTSSSLSVGRAADTAALPADMVSKVSPSFASPKHSATFVKPMPQPPPRRKGSALGLTIKTPSSPTHPSSLAPLQMNSPVVPPTPSLVRPSALRSFQSSPSLPLLTSRFPPERGMRLPDFPSTRNIPPAFASVLAERDENEESLNFDIPQSREEKPDAYPDGPICIYDPYVYLYFEPTVEQASEFGVIFNVASEVKNPYLVANSKDSHVSRTLDEAMREMELRPRTSSSPATPKQGDIDDPLVSKRSPVPEYIHIPWEHNTDIVPDLHKLVKIVDRRVQSGKKVLIHCQCGVSRSASLIVAYGLYKQPGISVQEAYDAVKKRSKWIGPNMNLIMQLQEFRSGLVRAKAGGEGGKSSNHANTASESGIPHTAPLMLGTGKNIPKSIKTGGLEKVAPGPSSAPSGLQWPSLDLSADSVAPTSATNASYTNILSSESSYVDATGNVISPSAVALSESSPMKTSSKDLTGLKLTSPHSYSPQPRIAPSHPPPVSFATMMSIPTPVESARSLGFGMASLNPSVHDETFGITSPRNTNFTSSPVSPRSAVDSLASSRSTEFGMAPFQPPELDDTATLGLTSPRLTNFGGASLFETVFQSVGATRDDPPAPTHRPPPPSHLPPAPPVSSQGSSKMTAILPTEESLQSLLNVQARAELRSQLGLSSKTSSNNMRSKFNSALQSSSPPSSDTKTDNQVTTLRSIPDGATLSYESSFGQDNVKTTTIALPKQSHASQLHEGDFAEALMSPRASEFTSNPFRGGPIWVGGDTTGEDFEGRKATDGGHNNHNNHHNNAATLQAGYTVTCVGDETLKAKEDDPRSPAQKGQSPIVRSIFDVFLT